MCVCVVGVKVCVRGVWVGVGVKVCVRVYGWVGVICTKLGMLTPTADVRRRTF